MSVKSTGINHSALILLVEAGAVNSVVALAKDDQWTLKVTFGDAEKTILAKNSGKARIWRKLDTLAKYLSGLGVKRFEIDMLDYDPSKKTLRRPDSAETLKRTHEAHKSLQEQAEEQEAITPIKKKLSPEKVKISWKERRARILKQENPRVK